MISYTAYAAQQSLTAYCRYIRNWISTHKKI
jgi:hypothetical protein